MAENEKQPEVITLVNKIKLAKFDLKQDVIDQVKTNAEAIELITYMESELKKNEPPAEDKKTKPAENPTMFFKLKENAGTNPFEKEEKQSKENKDTLNLNAFKQAMNPIAYTPHRYNHGGVAARIIPRWDPNTGMWVVF